MGRQLPWPPPSEEKRDEGTGADGDSELCVDAATVSVAQSTQTHRARLWVDSATVSVAPSTQTGTGVIGPRQLRVEHLDDGVVGIGERRPRLSWLLSDGDERQLAYQIEAAGRVHARVDADASVLVQWPDRLHSRQRVEWRVKVWPADAGESGWSTPAWFETGLLEPRNWVARWISPYEPTAHRTASDPRICRAARSTGVGPRPALGCRHRPRDASKAMSLGIGNDIHFF